MCVLHNVLVVFSKKKNTLQLCNIVICLVLERVPVYYSMNSCTKFNICVLQYLYVFVYRSRCILVLNYVKSANLIFFKLS